MVCREFKHEGDAKANVQREEVVYAYLYFESEPQGIHRLLCREPSYLAFPLPALISVAALFMTIDYARRFLILSPVANAATAYSTFASLRLGRTSQTVVGRLIRFWDSTNINKNGEFMRITLLLLDEFDSVIHDFIPVKRASQDRSSLKAGSIMRLDRFEVARTHNILLLTTAEWNKCHRRNTPHGSTTASIINNVTGPALARGLNP
ncbi:OB-fold-like protein [Raphanus sativus]|nr:OB-fold-like protein [Raphanus sativus]